jgi:dTDP-4-amino-4,6-dideoxygalactose transaminase
MDSILDVAKAHNLKILEDCAQAHGARYKGRSVGSMGDIGAWSFCQDKIMTTGGEGGMVTTRSDSYWSAMWSAKDHGKSIATMQEAPKTRGFRWVHESFGTNGRMLEMQATIARIQLTRMPAWTAARQRNAKQIWSAARQIKGLRVPDVPSWAEHAAYKAYVFVESAALKSGWNRDRIIAEINDRGVPCYSGSCSEIYLERAFDNTGWRPAIRLPIARELGESSLMFLVHPTLTVENIQQTCDVLESVMHSAVV